MTWFFQKVGAESPGKKLQEFLDGQQYSKKGILKYEQIFGDRYVSTGGERTTSDFCALIHLQKGQRVLDVGCGIGGSAFYMAKVKQIAHDKSGLRTEVFLSVPKIPIELL